MANAGAFKKGEKRPGQGRPPGTPNKATTTVREAIARLADGHAERFIGWLDAVADGDMEAGRPPDPKGAADLYLKAIEYHIPKLARSELTGPGGGAVQIVASSNDERI